MKKSIFAVIMCFIFTFGMMVTNDYAQAENSGTKLIIKNDQDIVSYDNAVKFEGENIYIALDALSNHLNILGDYDNISQVAVVTESDKVIRFYGNNKVKINQKEVENIAPMILIDERVFIPINQIKDDLKIKYALGEDGSIVLEKQIGNKVIAKAAENNINVREEAASWANAEDFLQQDEMIEIINEQGSWVKVLTPRGKIGYVQGDQIKDKETTIQTQNVNKPIWKPENGKILLTWEHVVKVNPDTSKIGELKGLNVVSPTWISLVDASGNIGNKISKDYIQWAKGRNYKIWATFTNSFDPKMTNEFFNNALAREKAINELITLVNENGLDGINIDFENIYLKDKERLVLFVRELTSVFHENGLVVSMDVTTKSSSENWSMCYDRKALGKTVDYIALMAYDQHYANGGVSGSVASIDWVEKGINDLLKDIPQEKLLLGVPFYTRIWMEMSSPEDPNKIIVKSKAASMTTINEILNRDGIVKVWDEKAGQYYVEYIENDVLNKIWIEDAASMKLRADLVKKYNLPGIASWRRGFETEDIWYVIDDTLNK